MTLDEARRILGLGPDEDPVPHFQEFRAARERIAQMVRTAPNTVLADRYQIGLIEFDQALAAVREAVSPSGEIPAPVRAAPDPMMLETAPPLASQPVILPFPPPVTMAEPEPVQAGPVEWPPVIPAHVLARSTPMLVPEKVVMPVEPVVARSTLIAMPQPVVPHIESQPVVIPTAPVVVLHAAPAVVAPEPVFAYGTPVVSPVPIPSEPVAVQSAPAVVAEPVVAAVSPEPVPAVAENAPTTPIHAEVIIPEPAPTQALPIDLPSPATDTAPVLAASKPAPVKRRGFPALAASLAILLTGVGAGYGYLLFEQDKRLERDREMVVLENKARIAIAARQWKEARDLSNRLQALNPTSGATISIRQELEAALAEANKQALLGTPPSTNASQSLVRILTLASAVLVEAPAQPKSAKAKATQPKAKPAQPDAKPAPADAKPLSPEAALAKAGELLATAKQHDTGKYDAEGYAAIHQAFKLAPQEPEIKALWDKFSAYPRTVHVPEECATAADALADVRDGDKVILGPGEWTGPLVVNAAVQIEGAGSDKTVVKCAPLDGPAITFGPSAKGVHVSGVAFRHTGVDPAADRFSAGLVRTGQVTFTECHFTDAAGHGLAVISGGQATASHCRFSSNGWDGASASGAGSVLVVSDSEVTNNTEHGLDLWDSATGTFTNDRCEGNHRNGILVDGGPSPISITGNQLQNNHQFGLVLDRASTGKVTGNTLAANQLGGLVIRANAAQLEVTGNHIQSDSVPGLALEKGVAKTAYTGNEILSATADNPAVVENVDFDGAVPEPPEAVVQPPAPKPTPKKPAPAPTTPRKKKK